MFLKKKKDKKDKDKDKPAKKSQTGSLPPLLKPTKTLEEELRSIVKAALGNKTAGLQHKPLADKATATGAATSSSPTSSNTSTAPAKVVPQKLDAFTVYWNTTPVTLPRANEWPKTYKLYKLQLYKKEKVAMDIYNESGDTIICTIPAAKVLAVEDSTRYFLAKNITVEKDTRNVGFAFYTREEAQTFTKIVCEDTKRDAVPIIIDMDKDPVPADEEATPAPAPTPAPAASAATPSITVSGEIGIEDEKEIDEDEMDEVQRMAKAELAKFGSAAEDQEAFDKLRNSLTVRLSTIGHGTIRTKEEKRVSIRTFRENMTQHESIVAARQSKNFPTICAIRRVVNAIADQVETTEKAKAIAAYLGKPEYDSYDGDLEPWVEQLFKECIGETSKTAVILKACTQAVVLCCTVHVKSKIASDILTGDVRGPEGWQVVILFANDLINVSHRRREKSLDMYGGTKEFWFEWLLNMCFKKDLNDIQSALLKIVALHFGANTDGKTKDAINKAFCGGDLLIA